MYGKLKGAGGYIDGSNHQERRAITRDRVRVVGQQRSSCVHEGVQLESIFLVNHTVGALGHNAPGGEVVRETCQL